MSAKFAAVPRFAAILVVAIGVLGLAGWAFDVVFLTSVSSTWMPIVPSTAVGLIVSGLSLYLLAGGEGAPRWIGRLCAVPPVVLGLIGLAVGLKGGGAGVEGASGRMAIATAMGLVLSGSALLLGRRKGLAFVALQSGVVATLSVCLINFLGHAYGAQAFYKASPFTGMAVPASAGLFILGLGILALDRDRGIGGVIFSSGPGGQVARILPPTMIVVSGFAGWLFFPGVRHEWFEPELGVALLIGVAMVAVSTVILWNAARINRADAARRESERDREESRVLFQELFESMPGGIVVVDEAGRITQVNRAGEKMFGYSREEIVGRPVEILMPEGDRARHVQSRAEYMTQPVFRPMGVKLAIGCRRKDGTLFPAEILLAPVRAAGATVVLSVVHDLTERKRAEEKLRSVEEQFRQAQKMEAVGQLAGGIAHDFNNILTAINGFGDLLLARLPEDSDLRPDVAEIRKAGDRAAALTRQILAFSRREPNEPRVVDPNASLSNLEKMLRRLIGDDIDLRVLKGSAVGRVRVDPGGLEQSLMNLVVNARDAMPGGGKLTIEVSGAQVADGEDARSLDLRPGPYVVIVVSDTGCGMDRETLSRAFEPFFTTKEPGKGTGLGLSVAYGFAQQSGGGLHAYSEPGAGSTFRLYLPCVDEEADRGETRSPLPGRGTGETILIVEDDPAVRRLAERVLGGKGYAVVVSSDPKEALEMVRGRGMKLDLVLTDVVMPGMSGPDLVREIRALRPSLRVLYMSGYTGGALDHRGSLEAGAPLVEKPFTAEALAGKVREVLDERQ